MEKMSKPIAAIAYADAYGKTQPFVYNEEAAQRVIDWVLAICKDGNYCEIYMCDGKDSTLEVFEDIWEDSDDEPYTIMHSYCNGFIIPGSWTTWIWQQLRIAGIARDYCC